MIDAAIVGAGIAGLSAAWDLTSRGRSVVVLEAAARPGGVIVTERVGGFVIDGGPDALLAPKAAGIALAREVGLGDRLVPTLRPRTAFVVRQGRLIPIPEASFLGIPTRVGPFVTTRLFSWPGKLRMALDVCIPRRAGGEDESIASFIGRRFGSEAVTYLAEPLLAGIHAGDVTRLSMSSLFPQLVALEREHGSIIRSLARTRGPRPADGAFRSFPGGLAELVGAVVERLPADVVQCGSPVRALEGHGPFALVMADGRRVEARSVILATPARITAQLIADFDADLAATLAQLRYASTATVALGYERRQVGHPLSGSGFVVPRAERRTVMAATWVSSKWPGRAPEGHVLLRGFVGQDSPALGLEDEEMGNRVAEELADRLSITGAPVVTRVFRWPNGTPQHEVGHAAWVARVERHVAARPGVFLTGSSYRATGIPDTIADARQVASETAAFLE